MSITLIYFGALAPYLMARRVRTWVRVPATVLTAALDQQVSGIPGRQRSVSYKASARYVYEFEGRRLEGDRVALADGFDSVGSFQQEAYATLASHRDNGTPVDCYVDPQDPDSSVLFPELRLDVVLFSLTFGVAFLLSGSYFIYLAARG